MTNERPLEAPNPLPPAAVPDTLASRMPRAFDPNRRGFAAPRPPGGGDPDLARARVEERRNLRILIGMVLAIVGGVFVVSIIGLIAGVTAGSGGGI
jgi:hypothetical protein